MEQPFDFLRKKEEPWTNSLVRGRETGCDGVVFLYPRERSHDLTSTIDLDPHRSKQQAAASGLVSSTRLFLVNKWWDA